MIVVLCKLGEHGLLREINSINANCDCENLKRA